MRFLLGKIRLAGLVSLTFIIGSCAAVDPGRIVGAGPPAIRPSQARALSTAPIKGEAAIFAFQPMSGAPSEMIFALEDFLKEEAPVRGINMVPANDPSATYIVRGYISAVGDAHNVIMVYVWDIFDQAGQRVNRISGREIAAGSGSDPWAKVNRNNMANAARETIDTLAEWIRE